MEPDQGDSTRASAPGFPDGSEHIHLIAYWGLRAWGFTTPQDNNQLAFLKSLLKDTAKAKMWSSMRLEGTRTISVEETNVHLVQSWEALCCN